MRKSVSLEVPLWAAFFAGLGSSCSDPDRDGGRPAQGWPGDEIQAALVHGHPAFEHDLRLHGLSALQLRAYSLQRQLADQNLFHYVCLLPHGLFDQLADQQALPNIQGPMSFASDKRGHNFGSSMLII